MAKRTSNGEGKVPKAKRIRLDVGRLDGNTKGKLELQVISLQHISMVVWILRCSLKLAGAKQTGKQLESGTT